MAVIGITFGIIFLAEIADTSGLVTLVLASRYSASLVLLGVCAAFVVQVGIAIAVGGVFALLPEQPLEIALAVIFVVGAVLLLRDDDDDDDVDIDKIPPTAWRVVATSFGVTMLSELGDPTQIITASLAARYQDPLAVGIGAVLALWSVSALAVLGGNRLQRLVPVRWVTRATAAILVVLAVLTAVEAFRG